MRLRGITDDGIRRIARKMGQNMDLPVMIPVDSSNVQEFGYDIDNRYLYVRFLAKATYPSTLYVYYDVEPEIYEQFLMAPSKGKFIWSHLRDRYEYARLE